MKTLNPNPWCYHYLDYSYKSREIRHFFLIMLSMVVFRLKVFVHVYLLVENFKKHAVLKGDK